MPDEDTTAACTVIMPNGDRVRYVGPPKKDLDFECFWEASFPEMFRSKQPDGRFHPEVEGVYAVSWEIGEQSFAAAFSVLRPRPNLKEFWQSLL